MSPNTIPVIVAAFVFFYSVKLIIDYTFFTCSETRCEVIDVRHLVMLLFVCIVSILYVSLELRWIFNESDKSLSAMDSTCWIVLETTYFTLMTYILTLFRERYKCPRSGCKP